MHIPESNDQDFHSEDMPGFDEEVASITEAMQTEEPQAIGPEPPILPPSVYRELENYTSENAYPPETDRRFVQSSQGQYTRISLPYDGRLILPTCAAEQTPLNAEEIRHLADRMIAEHNDALTRSLASAQRQLDDLVAWYHRTLASERDLFLANDLPYGVREMFIATLIAFLDSVRRSNT